MTVVAGILNKQGVAIAADSAVTVNGPNQRKVYNSANKIFTLSKFNPVGIAIYNSAQIAGIPWEVLIKEYRKQLGDKNFPLLNDYKDNFFQWLSDNKYFIEKPNNDYIVSDFLAFVQFLINEPGFRKDISIGKDPNTAFFELLDSYEKLFVPKLKEIETMKSINETEIKAILSPVVPKVLENLRLKFKLNDADSKIPPILLNAYIIYLKHDHFINYTGLIFTGFGDKEIFPQLITVNVSLVIDSKLRFSVDENKGAKVSDTSASFIRPFAQTDVIDTVLQGISPELKFLSTNVLGTFISSFIEEIKAVKQLPNETLKALNALNPQAYVQKYQQELENIVRQKYVNPLMGAVSQLSKEDLAEMAESLVYLTYLKRRFTMAEESVGGPVDVAVITKGDGFIWIKRKHYFDPELNKSFFQKYL